MLKVTNNYDLFELHEFNRDVGNITNLTNSMKTYGWIPAYPMNVVKNGGGRFKIKDGHHRFEVAKKLNIKAVYVECKDNVSITELNNTTKTWSLNDYLMSYVRAGYQAYIAVRHYVSETGIPLSISLALLAGEGAGSGNHRERFKKGTYKLGNQEHANNIKTIVCYMKKQGVGIANNNYFVKALSRIILVDGFSIAKFKDKISAHTALFEKKPNLQEYSTLIEFVYNRQSQDKMPLVFLADQEARKRSAAEKKH